MISRSVLFLDRIATLLLGAALLVAGVAAVWWWTDAEPLPERTDLGILRDAVGWYWFPWITAVAGLLLIVLGLRWIAAHVRNRRVSQLALPGSSADGKLTIDAGKATSATADELERSPGVRSAHGRIDRDRGQIVARIRVTLEPEADLGDVAASADRVSAQLARLIGRRDLRCSVELSVAGRGRRVTRVD